MFHHLNIYELDILRQGNRWSICSGARWSIWSDFIWSITATFTPTGEYLGFSSGSDGNVNGILTGITVTDGDITDANFGINKVPVSYGKTYTNLSPNLFSNSSGNSTYPLKIDLNSSSGTSDNVFNNSSNPSLLPGKLSGSDLEDGNYNGSTGTNNCKVTFTMLPNATSTILVYNGILLPPSPSNSDASYIYWNSVTGRYEIPDFNAGLLSVYLKRQNPGQDSGFSFKYSYIDNAGNIGSEATYLVKATGPLPVKFIRFTAVKINNNDVFLNWATASEINNSHFEVERSTDGVNFVKIGTEKSKAPSGQSNIILNYYLTDFNVANTGKQTLYYRVKQVDFDGSFAYTNIEVIKLKFNSTTRVYPNPTKDDITISFTPASDDEEVIITVTDMAGKVVYTEKATCNFNQQFIHKVSLKDIESGCYNATITIGSTSQTFQILKK